MAFLAFGFHVWIELSIINLHRKKTHIPVFTGGSDGASEVITAAVSDGIGVGIVGAVP